MTTQTITSERTAINHIPAMIRRAAWSARTTNFDIGAGPYDTTSAWLNHLGITNFTYDPYNRSVSHNQATLQYVMNNPTDTCTIVNVLNVIKEDDVKIEVLKLAKFCTKPGHSIYIGIHEGNRSNSGFVTTKGWQENKQRYQYYKYLREVWPVAAITFVKHGFEVKNI